MKYTYIIIVVVLLAVIVVLSFKKSEDNKNADKLLTDNSSNTDSSTSTNSGITTGSSSTIVTDSVFAKGDAVTVKSGSAMRRLSDPNMIDYQTTSAQIGWTIDRDLFTGSFKSGSTKATGTWAIISKNVVGFGFPSWVSGTNGMVKIYQVVHISRLTKA